MYMIHIHNNQIYDIIYIMGTCYLSSADIAQFLNTWIMSVFGNRASTVLTTGKEIPKQVDSTHPISTPPN